jgi:agmatine/peptidylarginine deiminase
LTPGNHHAPLFRFSPVLLSVFLVASVSRAQTAPVAPQHAANDVVILSLGALNPRAEHIRNVRAGVLADKDVERDAEKHLLEIQMNIVQETAKFGPVLLLAPDETTKAAIEQRCEEFQICQFLKNDRARIKVVPHDGSWIRDFGPQIESRGGAAYVAHWRYFDVRLEDAKREKAQELETARLTLLEARQSEGQPDTLTQEPNPAARKSVDSTIDARLFVLREYSQLLNETSPQRTNDESSAYDIADAVLATPDFAYKTSPTALDGGNLFKLDDGRCLTTRALLSRNKDQNINVDEELERVGGCKQVAYLDPLPGPVIEHIDLFALPVGGKRILLAAYDLKNPFATEYWNNLSDAERDLAAEADLAMETNSERLHSLGYEVIKVPSPFPRIPENGHTYYPSVQNTLVRSTADGYRQLLLPSYKDYETELQSSAVQRIAAAFGPNTEIVSIEATEAAKHQGAIHCLTLTAPLALSIFGDSADIARRSDVVVQRVKLDARATEEIAAQVPANGLQGSWAILKGDRLTDETPPNIYPQKIFFGEHEFQRGVLDQLESAGKYTIDRRSPAAWSLHFVFPDQNVVPAVVDWVSKDEVKLVLEDGKSTLLLKRTGSDRASPFKREERSSPQVKGQTGMPSRKRASSTPETQSTHP